MALRILQLGTVFAIGLHLSPAISFAETTGVGSEIPPLTVQLKDPKDVIAIKGQPATLRCDVQSTSNTHFNVEWLYNDMPIPQNDSRRILQQDSSLYIPKVYGGKKVGNSSCVTGSYRCKVSYDVGVLLSNPAKLKIASFDREFSKLSDNSNVFESQPALLFCIIHSVPTAEIQWERNTKRLPQNSRYVPLPTGALLITKTHSSDAGSYRCVATNNVLEKTKRSKFIELSISQNVIMKPEAPTFLPLDILPNATVLVGESINFYCAVTGWPNPTIQWLNNDSKVVGNSSVLQFQNATLLDTGNYTCVAYNSVGRISQKYALNVYQKPYFNVTLTSRFYPNSHTARLDCQAKGTPEPEIYWYKDGKRLIPGGRIKNPPSGLVLSHTFSYDSGIYQCFASNSAGKVWTAGQIKIASGEKLNPPQNLECRPFDDNSICLSWQSPVEVPMQVYTIYSFIHKDTGLELSGDYIMVDQTVLMVNGLNNRTNYTFYTRLFAKTASDESNNVTCQTGTVGKRDLRVTPINDTSVQLQWSKISKDVPCDGTKVTYKILWRRRGARSSTVEYTEDMNYLITGLSSSNEYEFSVVTKYDTNPLWVAFILSNTNLTTNKVNTEIDNNNNELIAPENVEAMPVLPTEVNLTWFEVKGANYYNICYTKVKDQKKCEESTIVKSNVNILEVFKLEPNTVYEFKVKAHKNEEEFGPFSKSIEIRTPADVPSSVVDLSYKIINSTAICLHWKAPLHKNGNLRKYVITYTPDSNWPLEKWLTVSVPSLKRKLKPCWTSDEKSVSILLGNLESNKNYTVFVRADSDVGLGSRGIAYFTTNIGKTTDYTNDSQNNIQHNQKLGIIMGVTIALVCIVACISCILARKQCLKSRALARTRMNASNNYYPAIAHYASDSGGVQVRLEDPCAAEIHEIEHLVNEDQPTHTQIPTITTPATHLDTKGAANFPNGHINGSFKPYANGYSSNGSFNITENPRYVPECNGHIKKKSRDQYEEDSNSNLKTSKLQDLQRLFENSKLLQSNKPMIIETKSKKQQREQQQEQCNPHFENVDGNVTLPLSNNLTNASSEDDSLNSTQFTFLDNSLPSPLSSNSNHHRRISPVLGPNG